MYRSNIWLLFALIFLLFYVLTHLLAAGHLCVSRQTVNQEPYKQKRHCYGDYFPTTCLPNIIQIDKKKHSGYLPLNTTGNPHQLLSNPSNFPAQLLSVILFSNNTQQIPLLLNRQNCVFLIPYCVKHKKKKFFYSTVLQIACKCLYQMTS